MILQMDSHRLSSSMEQISSSNMNIIILTVKLWLISEHFHFIFGERLKNVFKIHGDW